jgi:hypothetical protein
VLLLDGEDVSADASVEGDTLRYEPGDLEDGERELVVAEAADDATPSRTTRRRDADDGTEGADGAEGTADGPTPLHAWRFEVKASRPTLELHSPDGAVAAGEPVTVPAPPSPARPWRSATSR